MRFPGAETLELHEHVNKHRWLSKFAPPASCLRMTLRCPVCQADAGSLPFDRTVTCGGCGLRMHADMTKLHIWPASTRHTIRTKIPVKFTFPGAGEREVAHPEITIVYSIAKGENGEPDQPTVVDATLVEDDGLNPTPADVSAWAQAWLDGDGYERACEAAQEGAL
jgi:hypothetical protein